MPSTFPRARFVIGYLWDTTFSDSRLGRITSVYHHSGLCSHYLLPESAHYPTKNWTSGLFVFRRVMELLRVAPQSLLGPTIAKMCSCSKVVHLSYVHNHAQPPQPSLNGEVAEKSRRVARPPRRSLPERKSKSAGEAMETHV